MGATPGTRIGRGRVDSHRAVRKAPIEPATKLPMAVSLVRTSGFVQGRVTVEVVTRVAVGHSRVSTGQSVPAGSDAACTAAMVTAARSTLTSNLTFSSD